LAMAFYFDDLSESLRHSHHIIDLYQITKRLDDPEFDTNPQTDYLEFSALLTLLDIAVDDGHFIKLDLTNAQTAKEHDEDVDALGARIKSKAKGIGNPGAAFISRIEAKEIIELVSSRIGETVRTKRKPKESILDGPPVQAPEDLERERKGMMTFLSRQKA
jgi:hypothetical protein